MSSMRDGMMTLSPAAYRLAVSLVDFFRHRLPQEEAQAMDRSGWIRLLGRLQEAVWAGHTCLLTSETEAALLNQCPSLWRDGEGHGTTPLVWRPPYLFMQRLWQLEQTLARQLVQRLQNEDGACAAPDWLSEMPLNAAQRRAVTVGLRQPVTLITGGPGTGKTTTLRYLLAALRACRPEWRIALAAPTGKAAGRMLEAIEQGRAHLPAALQPMLQGLDAFTLHRLLGMRPDRPQARYGPGSPLPWDVVVVDEASMVDLPMMARLVSALPPAGRLILLGDADQLASVETGAVLRDLCAALSAQTVHLTESHRSNRTILDLARAVNAGEVEAVEACLRSEHDALCWLSSADDLPAVVWEGFAPYRAAVAAFEAGRGCVADCFAALSKFRVLCAHRHGPGGVVWLNRWLRQRWGATGEVIIITENQPDMQLYNGDVGIVLPDETGAPVAWFPAEEGGFRHWPLEMLPHWETAFAMTVHQSQGSEFDAVLLVLPPKPSPVLSRALLYTAITRARSRFTLWGEASVLAHTVQTALQRHSGLVAALTEALAQSAGTPSGRGDSGG